MSLFSISFYQGCLRGCLLMPSTIEVIILAFRFSASRPLEGPSNLEHSRWKAPLNFGAMQCCRDMKLKSELKARLGTPTSPPIPSSSSMPAFYVNRPHPTRSKPQVQDGNGQLDFDEFADYITGAVSMPLSSLLQQEETLAKVSVFSFRV